MGDFVVGGYNKAVFYRFKLKADKTGWDCLDKLTDAVVAAPTEANAALILQGPIESTKPTPDEAGLINTELSQYAAGKDVWDFLDEVAVPTVATTYPDKTMEDGVKKTSQASDELVVQINYLFPDDMKTPTKRFVYAVPGSIDRSSGAFETKGDDYIAPAFKHQGKAVPVADLTLKKELFDAAIVTVGTDIVIKKGTPHHRAFYAIPA